MRTSSILLSHLHIVHVKFLFLRLMLLLHAVSAVQSDSSDNLDTEHGKNGGTEAFEGTMLQKQTAIDPSKSCAAPCKCLGGVYLKPILPAWG